MKCVIGKEQEYIKYLTFVFVVKEFVGLVCYIREIFPKRSATKDAFGGSSISTISLLIGNNYNLFYFIIQFRISNTSNIINLDVIYELFT